MPQFTEFPSLPEGAYRAAVDRFIGLVRAMPAEGEPFKAFRGRLKKAGMWNRERLPTLLRFLRVAHADPMHPSEIVTRIAQTTDEDAAREVLIERLRDVNPLLMREILLRLDERVHSSNEILKYLDSFAYPGARVGGPQTHAWMNMAQGLGLFRPLGIRLALTDRAKAMLPWAKDFDIDDFLEEDTDEAPATAPEVVPSVSQTVEVTTEAAPAPVAQRVAPTPPPAPAPSSPALPSPLGTGPSLPTRRFATTGRFADDVLQTTTDRLVAWWVEREKTTEAPKVWFGVDGESWQEDAERALFRLAVGAALTFRHQAGAFDELDRSGAIEALYEGTVDDIPAVVDARALMLTSLVARRLAEHPTAAATIEKCTSAEAVMDALEQTVGRGLFSLELFWLVRELAALGVLRVSGLAAYSALPTRAVRDALFRFGFLESPYAPDGAALTAAAAAASSAAGGAAPSDEALEAFALAAGCAYSCPNRKRCDLPCRERAE